MYIIETILNVCITCPVEISIVLIEDLYIVQVTFFICI